MHQWPNLRGVDISADADLIVDGLLLDFKSTHHPRPLPKHTAWQLLGHLLLDTHDRYRTDSLGLYLTRSAGLVSDCLWSVLILAHRYDVDLKAAFLRTMDELDRSRRH
ncbi:hypothetical protein [Streptomyces atratus]